MSKKVWLVVIGASLALLLAGCSSGQTNSTATPASPPASNSAATPTQQGAAGQSGGQHMSAQQRQQFMQNLRSGKVVSLTATSVTVAVAQGGADVGTNATYNLTSSTVVRKDRSTVSTSGQVPDLASLGLKTGYWAILSVQNNNVTSIQFNSNGAQPQRPTHNGSKPSGSNQNGSAPSQ